MVVRTCQLSCVMAPPSQYIWRVVQIVGRVIAANAVPDTIVSLELEEKLAKDDGEKPMPMTVEQRQELLMRVLTENGSIGKLDGPGWSPQTALRGQMPTNGIPPRVQSGTE